MLSGGLAWKNSGHFLGKPTWGWEFRGTLNPKRLKVGWTPAYAGSGWENKTKNKPFFVFVFISPPFLLNLDMPPGFSRGGRDTYLIAHPVKESRAPQLHVDFLRSQAEEALNPKP